MSNTTQKPKLATEGFGALDQIIGSGLYRSRESDDPLPPATDPAATPAVDPAAAGTDTPPAATDTPPVATPIAGDPVVSTPEGDDVEEVTPETADGAEEPGAPTADDGAEPDMIDEQVDVDGEEEPDEDDEPKTGEKTAEGTATKTKTKFKYAAIASKDMNAALKEIDSKDGISAKLKAIVKEYEGKGYNLADHNLTNKDAVVTKKLWKLCKSHKVAKAILAGLLAPGPLAIPVIVASALFSANAFPLQASVGGTPVIVKAVKTKIANATAKKDKKYKGDGTAKVYPAKIYLVFTKVGSKSLVVLAGSKKGTADHKSTEGNRSFEAYDPFTGKKVMSRESDDILPPAAEIDPLTGLPPVDPTASPDAAVDPAIADAIDPVAVADVPADPAGAVDGDAIQDTTVDVLNEHNTIERALTFMTVGLEHVRSVESMIGNDPARSKESSYIKAREGAAETMAKVSAAAKAAWQKLVEAIQKFFFKVTNFIRSGDIAKKVAEVSKVTAYKGGDKKVVDPKTLKIIIAAFNAKGWIFGEKNAEKLPSTFRTKVQELAKTPVEVKDKFGEIKSVVTAGNLKLFQSGMKELLDAAKANMSKFKAEENKAGYQEEAKKAISEVSAMNWMGIRGFSWFISLTNAVLAGETKPTAGVPA